MTFYVQKTLANGPIRFGVSPRQALEAIDADTGLSTGARGEFLRRRREGFYFSDERNIKGASLPVTKTLSSTPFWSSLKPDGTRRGWLFLASMILGVIFILLGFAVVARKGKVQGWVEVILGVAMVATPIVMTAQRRKQIHDQEEKERAEREAREKRHREMLASYTAALARVKERPDEAALAELTREREALELPYEIWSPLARQTVLHIGFAELGRVGTIGSRDVARLMDGASRAAGLSPEDETGAKLDLYRIVLWHLLADDRLGDAQENELLALRKGLDIWDRDVPLEAGVADQFRRLRGIDRKSLPRVNVHTKLGFHEYAIHSAKGAVMKTEKQKKVTRLVAGDPAELIITNKRVLIATAKPIDVPLMQIDDVEVDVDANVLTIRTPKNPVSVQVADPVYTATLIDIATTIDERPKGFA